MDFSLTPSKKQKTKQNCAAGFGIHLQLSLALCGSVLVCDFLLFDKTTEAKSPSAGIDFSSNHPMWKLAGHMLDSLTAGLKEVTTEKNKTTGCYWLQLRRSIATGLELACRGKGPAGKIDGRMWCIASSWRQGGCSDDDEHKWFYRVSRIDCGRAEGQNSASRQGSRFLFAKCGAMRPKNMCVWVCLTGRILRNPTTNPEET